MNPTEDDSVRLDSWLWAARFYKTRPLAASAVKNGRISVNGTRAKPARALAVGDTVRIGREDGFEMEVIVKTLTHKRVCAKTAQGFYEETAQSLAAREHWQTQRMLARNLVQFPENRPDKRQRRQLRAIRHQDDF